MFYPDLRLRRLRMSNGLRRLKKETVLSLNDLIYPVFVIEGSNVKEEIPSMPGVFRYSVDRVEEVINQVVENGIPAIILFGIPKNKDDIASQAYAENGIIQQATRKIKMLNKEITVITDLCLCEYTDHGHCGLIKNGIILNDETLEIISKIAISQVNAGSDMVAPSGMMDGAVKIIRDSLDNYGFNSIPIMAYAAKYYSSFYGPFRDAAESAPQFGDRKSYQMDAANFKEAMLEVETDIQEGADIIMIKPALPYLDIIKAVSGKYNYPIAAYQVSGEYSMIKAAGINGWIDEQKVTWESALSIKRAGSDIILTYFAVELAKLIKEGWNEF